MGRTTVTRRIEAPLDQVFRAVAHIEEFEKIVPAIVKIEFLSDSRTGVGTRFRETRLMGKREGSTELEVTEYVPNERMRCVADQGGTLWDTTFTTRELGDGTVELTMVMDANAYKLAARLLNPLIRGMVQRHIEADMDAVKAWCEGGGAEAAAPG